jgi:acetylornithine/succinyldiaminopimelate/putrescine aminotransferase
MQTHRPPFASNDRTHPLAVAIANVLGGFEFVRDIHATGITIGIETDLNSIDIVRAAKRSGLCLARAGSTSMCLQPPLVFSDDDQKLLLSRLHSVLESLERESAELSI